MNPGGLLTRGPWLALRQWPKYTRPQSGGARVVTNLEAPGGTTDDPRPNRDQAQHNVRQTVFRGTRITVEHILGKLAGGMTVGEILVDHPHLTPDNIYAAAAFAADYLAQEEIVFADGERL